MIKPRLEKYHSLLRIKEENGQRYIFDPVRKHYLRVQPEELVRQSWITCLAEAYGQPLSNMAVEKKLRLHGLEKRFDLVLYQRAQAHVLFEFKSFNVLLNETVARQAAAYNLELRLPYIVISNGMEHYAFQIDRETSRITPCDKLDFLFYSPSAQGGDM